MEINYSKLYILGNNRIITFGEYTHRLDIMRSYYQMENEITIESAKNATINKLVVNEHCDLNELVPRFKQVNTIIKYRSNTLCFSSLFLHNPTKSILAKIQYKYEDTPTKVYIKNIHQLHKITPHINHVCINITHEFTNDILLNILSHSFEHIKISIDGDYDIDIDILVDLLINNTAKHIHIKNIQLSVHNVVRLINKPGIISLRLHAHWNYRNTASNKDFNSITFDENYTILRFRCIGYLFEVEILVFQSNIHLPDHIFRRNIQLLNDQRFKKVKAIM